MSDIEAGDTPTKPPGSLRPHVQQPGPDVLDEALRQTGTHKATRTAITGMASDLKLVAHRSLLIFYAVLVLAACVVALTVWQAVSSREASRRFDIVDKRLERLERLERAHTEAP